MTVAWSPDELERIGTAEELHIATKRADGTLRREVPIWVVSAAAALVFLVAGSTVATAPPSGRSSPCSPGTSPS
jgi:hypothetical protein